MPGVTVAGDRTLRVVAATGLPIAAPELPAKPLEGYAWEQLVAGARVQRMQGLLADAVAEGRLPATEAQHREVADLHRAALDGVERIERTLVDAASVLAGAGIEAVVLKGSASAHLDYPHPALRVFGDADLLLRADAFAAGAEALLDAGYRRPRPEARRGHDRRLGASLGLVDSDNVQVDLHRTLAGEPFGLLIRADDLFSRLEGFTVAGVRLQALSTPCRFLTACYRAVLGTQPVRLVPLRDAAGIALGGRLDRDAAIELAERWQGGAIVARAVGLAWRAFGLDPDDPLARWAVTRPEDGCEHALLAPFGPEGRQRASRMLATLQLLDGLGTKAAYVKARLLPGGRRLRSHRLSRAG